MIRQVFHLFVMIGAVSLADGQEPIEDSLDRDYSEELPRIAPLEPEEALGTFEVHPGFRMELVAAEPVVFDPIAFAFDEDSRLYTVEMRGYSEQRDEHMGALRLLEDSTGDGLFDKSTVFLDGLAWPTAVACYDGGVFVGAPPNVLYCKDTTGDGKADVVETVYTGFGLSNVQGLLNSFNWALDNRIHGATSSSGAEVRGMAEGAAGTPVTLRGRDFAFDPRTYAFEAESGGAQHGLGFDDWGRKFVSHNSDHIQLIVYEDRYAARNPYFAAPSPRESIAADGPAADVFRISPVEPWRIVRTRLRLQGIVPGPIEGGGRAAGYFTSATGVTIYRGDAWPEVFRGNAIVGDVGGNLIHRKTLESRGVSLVARRADAGTEFVRSTDIWFRPVQFCNGPDGALYVADMYREVIEHPDSLPPIIKRHLDLTSGNDRGRIYRIVPDGHERQPWPRLSGMPGEELAGLLEHANAWHRETAQRLLYERQDESAIEPLNRILMESEYALGRLHALYTLDGLGALRVEHVARGLADREARVREHALRLAERFLKGGEESAPQRALMDKAVALAEDSDLRVRFQATFTLGTLAPEEKAAPLAGLAREDGNRPWFETALMTSLADGGDRVLAILLADESYRVAEDSGRLLEGLARQTGAAGSAERVGEALAAIETLPPEENALGERLIRGMLDGVRTAGRGADIGRILAESPVAQGHLERLLSEARRVAGEPGSDGRRVAAVRTLGLAEFGDAGPLLVGLLDAREAPVVQSAALATLRTFDAGEVADSILEAWPVLGPAQREQAVEILLSRGVWAERLLEGIAGGTFNRVHLTSTRVHQLRNHGDEGIRRRAEQILAGDAGVNRQHVVEAYEGSLGLAGDRERGRTIYLENCAQCHRAEGRGHAVGPDLVTVSNSGLGTILLNVLDPNREINPEYTNYLVETTDWETLTGIIAAETASSITLRRANGEEDTILRTNIESIRSTDLSLMPEGWEESLDVQAMADLLAYVSTLE